MQDNAPFFLVLRIIFAGLFIASLLAGVYLFKNYQKLFGVDPNVPSESDGARLYSVTLVFGVWAHIVLITGAFALLL